MVMLWALPSLRSIVQNWGVRSLKALDCADWTSASFRILALVVPSPHSPKLLCA